MISAIRYMAYSTARRLGADEQGATATEYIFLLVFIAIAIIVGAQLLGGALNDGFQGAADSVNDGLGGGGGS